MTVTPTPVVTEDLLSTVIHIKYNVIDYNVRLVLSWPPRLRARGTIPWHPPPCPDTRATASPAPPRRPTADTAAFRRSRAQALASSWPLAHLCTRAHTCELCLVPLGPITLSCHARSTAQRHRDTQRALCTSTSTHTGRLATLHYWLTLQRQPLPTTGGGLTKVPAGRGKTCAKNTSGGVALRGHPAPAPTPPTDHRAFWRAGSPARAASLRRSAAPSAAWRAHTAPKRERRDARAHDTVVPRAQHCAAAQTHTACAVPRARRTPGAPYHCVP